MQINSLSPSKSKSKKRQSCYTNEEVQLQLQQQSRKRLKLSQDLGEFIYNGNAFPDVPLNDDEVVHKII